MANQGIQEASVPDSTNAPTLIPIASTTGQDSPLPTSRRTSAALPPDVEAARRARVNIHLKALIERPHIATPSSACSASVKGIGLYTHVQAPQQPPILSNQRSGYVEPKGIFLPCGGERRQKHGNTRGGLGADLPGEVKSLYEEVKSVLGEEEKLANEEYDLKERFGGLGFWDPDIAVPSPPPLPPPAGKDGDVALGGTEYDVDSRSSILCVESRRTSVTEEGIRGGRRPSVQANDSAMSGADTNTPTSAKTASVIDTSRDPRRRR